MKIICTQEYDRLTESTIQRIHFVEGFEEDHLKRILFFHGYEVTKDDRVIKSLINGIMSAGYILEREEDVYKMQCMFYFYRKVRVSEKHYFYICYPKTKERVDEDKKVILKMLNH